jgi:hypothetical protein
MSSSASTCSGEDAIVDQFLATVKRYPMDPVWHILWTERSENGAECLNAILIFRDYFSFNGGQKAANGRQEVEDGLTELASSSTTAASDCATLRSLHDYYAQCRACAGRVQSTCATWR